MRNLLCLLFIIYLWRSESKSDLYDSETCGLPTKEFAKAQKEARTIEKPVQKVTAQPFQEVDDNKVMDDDYSPDYELNNETDDLEDDPNDPMRTKL
ncbi:hypothetical protein ANCCAN_20853 [Ancylostoma caninum]|uniref:Uncharacterized protein n=1 Tax=Ancylostoma caninum TaxID=29170 RepID=A0A368FP72_ANCCA|nr:hypothetical protein ANCCAN_20853 [Ancylostoma caninum]